MQADDVHFGLPGTTEPIKGRKLLLLISVGSVG
jgi:hypothetical protein